MSAIVQSQFSLKKVGTPMTQILGHSLDIEAEEEGSRPEAVVVICGATLGPGGTAKT